MPPALERLIAPVRRHGMRSFLIAVSVVGVIAGILAQNGLKVVVLEGGGYFNESDFNQSELWAFQNLYWRGGPTPTADFNLGLQAGACLGGGTVVNWMTNLRTPSWVREQWAGEHGLEGVDGGIGADGSTHLICCPGSALFNAPHSEARRTP